MLKEKYMDSTKLKSNREDKYGGEILIGDNDAAIGSAGLSLSLITYRHIFPGNGVALDQGCNHYKSPCTNRCWILS